MRHVHFQKVFLSEALRNGPVEGILFVAIRMSGDMCFRPGVKSSFTLKRKSFAVKLFHSFACVRPIKSSEHTQGSQNLN